MMKEALIMRSDFCALILTHGRPQSVNTYDVLRRFGYTGPIYLLIDDEDTTADQYIEKYGDQVVSFSKEEISTEFDIGDNFLNQRGSVVYARNASFSVVRDLGFKYFIALDDDYTDFRFRLDGDGNYTSIATKRLDAIFDELVQFLIDTPFYSIAMAQGGDHIGGGGNIYLRSFRSHRKLMNTFICDVDRPFEYYGRINEDVNVYTCSQRRGIPFLSFMYIRANQKQTQANAGGLTDIYLDVGTYVKSFYSVMYAPSCVKVAGLNTTYGRLHHLVNWNATAPKIISEQYKKTV